MITLYAWPTPNSQKVAMMLEELGLPYRSVAVDITKGDQFADGFIALSPTSQIPVIVDERGLGKRPVILSESAAILLYLADKADKLCSGIASERANTLQWLMFATTGIGPAVEKMNHLQGYSTGEQAFEINANTRAATKMLTVLNKQLREHPFLAGEHYSIADIAAYPWVIFYDKLQRDFDDFPHVSRWYQTLSARPALQRGMRLLDELITQQSFDAVTRHILYGIAANF